MLYWRMSHQKLTNAAGIVNYLKNVFCYSFVPCPSTPFLHPQYIPFLLPVFWNVKMRILSQPVCRKVLGKPYSKRVPKISAPCDFQRSHKGSKKKKRSGLGKKRRNQFRWSVSGRLPSDSKDLFAISRIANTNFISLLLTHPG